ncbi:MAG: T9SS type A sorting domain-containing protein [Rhizobacter sp.]|nr:T9SS type A sorting domain-containing protein [Chlorobiales bacterium]
MQVKRAAGQTSWSGSLMVTEVGTSRSPNALPRGSTVTGSKVFAYTVDTPTDQAPFKVGFGSGATFSGGYAMVSGGGMNNFSSTNSQGNMADSLGGNGNAFSNSDDGSASLTVEASPIPTAFGLLQNYPNPFNPTTAIQYQLPIPSKVSLKVFDLLGREVQTLVNDTKPAGYYQANFNASQLASGTYFYKLQAGTFVQTKRLTVVK